MNRDETLFSFFLFFFTRGGCASRLRAYLSARLLPQSYQYPNSKMPEIDTRSVISTQILWSALTESVDSCAETKSASSVA